MSTTATRPGKPRFPQHRREPLTPERDALVAEHFAWAKGVARSARPRTPSRLHDPIESEVLWALYLAAGEYDEARGVKFRAYAAPRLYGAIATAIRDDRLKGFRRAADRPDVLPIGVDGDGDGLDPPADEEPPGAAAESHDEIRARLAALPDAHREMMLRLFTRADEATLAGLGRAFGVSESQASLIYTNSVETIRRSLGLPPAREVREERQAGMARRRERTEAAVLEVAEELSRIYGHVQAKEVARRVGVSETTVARVRSALTPLGRWPWPDGQEVRRFRSTGARRDWQKEYRKTEAYRAWLERYRRDKGESSTLGRLMQCRRSQRYNLRKATDPARRADLERQILEHTRQIERLQRRERRDNPKGRQPNQYSPKAAS